MTQFTKSTLAEDSAYRDVIAALEENLIELDRLGAAIAAAQLQAAICILRNERSDSLVD